MFLALAEQLHFRRTAEHVGITTGRISQTTEKLERLSAHHCSNAPAAKSAEHPATGRRPDPLVAGVEDAVRRAVDAGRGITGDPHVGSLGAINGTGVFSQKLSCGVTTWGTAGYLQGSYTYVMGSRDGKHSVAINVNGDWNNAIGNVIGVIEARFCPPAK
ncbi:helix-turn-helix domain-containing protein [Streptosporangium sp. CA-135522]|uniref:helix-turn-helix domain-containing protein n=1 Tax=Streptosporangium sp. CA-135522 TaxID=3240072 RepID=UPI003D8CBB65